MHPRKIGFLIFLAMVICAMPVQAAQFSGNYLLQVCSSDASGKEIVSGGHIACQAYISGVMDYHNLVRSLGTAPSVEFCVPDTVNLNDIQAKVATYLSANRKIHGAFVASPAVALALYHYYPCRKAKK